MGEERRREEMNAEKPAAERKSKMSNLGLPRMGTLNDTNQFLKPLESGLADRGEENVRIFPNGFKEKIYR